MYSNQYHSPLENAYPEDPNEIKYSPYYERYYQGSQGPQRPQSFRGGDCHGRGDGSQQPYDSSSSDYSRRQSKPRIPKSHPGTGPSASSSRGPTYMDQYKTSSYSEELTRLFGAVECRLCGIEVTAPIVAKMHYSGKQHAKKVKNFLEEWCLRTGNPMPTVKEALSSPASTPVSKTPEHCDLCDVTMLTLNDKLLHLAGKQHRKNVADPANAKKRKREVEYAKADDPRFGIGAQFRIEEESEEREKKVTKLAVPGVFSCDLCGVNAVSQEQLDAHLNGKKHKEKLKKKDSTVPTPEYQKNFSCDRCNLWFDTMRMYNMHLNGKRHLRTLLKSEADGFDKCDICDCKFTSFEQYQAHIQGKKHKKECEKGLKVAMDVKTEKVSIACKVCPYIGSRIDTHYCDRSLEKRGNFLKDTKMRCEPCGEVFGSEHQMEEHYKTRRHALCLLNKEGGDRVIPEFEHWYCIVCKEQHKSQKAYTEHMFSEKHLSLEKEHQSLGSKTDLFHCLLCDLIMDQEAKEEHMVALSHRREVMKKFSQKLIADLANKNDRTLYYHCSDCPSSGDMTFLEYNAHLLHNDHLDRVLNYKYQQRTHL